MLQTNRFSDSRVSRQWFSRPDDERWTNLISMCEHFRLQRSNSTSRVVANTDIEFRPSCDDPTTADLLLFHRKSDMAFELTNWSAGQACQRAKAPADWIKSVPAALAADNINWGLHMMRGIEDLQLLMTKGEKVDPDSPAWGTSRAITGPKYGRIWNFDVLAAIIAIFGDGVNGDFTVPGVYGNPLDSITKANTTLFASDRDFNIFLADEKNRIEIPNRRSSVPGGFARGIGFSNSEVGDCSFVVFSYIFDYVCGNRIIWNIQFFDEKRIRHTGGAPARWLGEIQPAIKSYASGSAKGITDGIEAARATKLSRDGITEWLAKRFFNNKTMANAMDQIHLIEEGRPIENIWDASVAATAYARNVPHQDARMAIERRAGELLTVNML